MEKIGRYEVIHELGRGGMAAVYLAHDPAFGRQVAIKVLPPQFLHEQQFRTRFQREARIIAALEHPYIVPVYDYGEEGEQPFIVMRYMPGGTLAGRMTGQPTPLAAVMPIVQRLAEALDEAHSHYIVHRDLKPSNVMFDAHHHAFLSDFGIAKMLEASVALTGSGVIGTPAYMSPEQAVGEHEIDGRSDVYSLGIMLYEMLTGRHPYAADTPMRLMLKHVTEPVPQLNVAEVALLSLPSDCNEVLARALAKKPGERYSTTGEMVEALSTLLTSGALRGMGLTGTATPATLPPSHEITPVPVTPPPISTAGATPAPVVSGAATTQPAPKAAEAPAEAQPATRVGLSLSPWQLGVGGLILVGVITIVVIFLLTGGGGGRSTPTPSPSPTFAATALPSVTAVQVLTQPPTDTPLPPTATSTLATTQTAAPTLTATPGQATATPFVPATPKTARATATRIIPTNTPPPRPSDTPPPASPTEKPLPQPTDTPLPSPPPPLPTDTPAPPATNTPVPPEETATPAP